MFGNFNLGTVVLIVLAIVIYLYLQRLEKKEKSGKTATLYERYKTLTPETLSALPNEELVRAVVANLLARGTDLYKETAVLSHSRTAVYSVWLFCNEIAAADFEKLSATSRRFADVATDGFLLLGAEQCAAALTALTTAFAENALTADLSAALRDAIAAETPLESAAAYIRENIAEFCDL